MKIKTPEVARPAGFAAYSAITSNRSVLSDSLRSMSFSGVERQQTQAY